MAEVGLRGLAEFASGITVAALSPAVVEKGRACLLYALTVGAASARAEAPAQAARALAGEGGDGRATRLLDGRRGSPEAAAMANAVLLHSRVQEDAHPAGHMGVVVVPRVEVVSDDARPRYRPRLSLELSDGRRLEWEETAGDDAYRLTWAEAVRMTEVLAAEAGVSEASSAQLVRAVESLGSAASAGDLVDAARRATAEGARGGFRP